MRSILITGASQGIGRATALALAEPGRHLALAARGAAALEDVAAQVRARGAEALALPCDVRDEAQVRELLARAAGEQGRLDMLVNSAGGATVAPIEQLGVEEWRQALDTLLTGAFLVCKQALPLLPAGGLIVNVGSVAARQAFPGWAAYSAAKAGLLAFGNVLREELRERGVRVTTILPAATNTPLWDGLPGEWPRANMLRAEDVARAILDLAALPPYAAVEELTIGHVAGRL
jgi:3-oxoacyl-[acyl-carrier protein] reductase